MTQGKILEKMWSKLPGVATHIDIDSEQNAVRFDFYGVRFRVDICMSVEIIESGLLVSNATASLMQALLRS